MQLSYALILQKMFDTTWWALAHWSEWVKRHAKQRHINKIKGAAMQFM